MNLQNAIPGFYQSDYVPEACKPFALLSGHSRCLVLVHGLTGTPNDFHGYAERFAGSFDVYAPLLPGHGSHVCHLQHLGIRELMIPLPALLGHLRHRYREIHLTGMSYGAILAVMAAMEIQVSSLAMIAPAFVLTSRSERNMIWVRRLGMHLWWPRLTKSSVYRDREFSRSNEHTYTSIALRPTEALHKCANYLVTQLERLEMPVWHCHGDMDDTTPMAANHALLKARIKRYDFHQVQTGKHVLTLGPASGQLASEHLDWLQRHCGD